MPLKKLIKSTKKGTLTGAFSTTIFPRRVVLNQRLLAKKRYDFFDCM